MPEIPVCIATRPRTAVLYACFFAGCWATYQKFEVYSTTGTYDYILTLSAGMQALAFALLSLDTKSGIGEGLSKKMLWVFLLAHTIRLCTTVPSKGYTPEDSTGDVYLYQLLELIGVLLLAYKIKSLTALRAMNTVGSGGEDWKTVAGIAAISVVLAYFTKSTGHGHVLLDTSWMFSVWLDAFALFPQVTLLCTTCSFVDETAAHFANLTLMASITFAIFWGRCAKDRYAEFERAGEHGFFYAILAASCIRVVLCSAYFYLFTRVASTYKGAMVSSHKGEYELCGTRDDNFDEL